MTDRVVQPADFDADHVVDSIKKKIRSLNISSGVGDPTDPPTVPEKDWIYADKSADPVVLWFWDSGADTPAWVAAGSGGATSSPTGGLTMMSSFRLMADGVPAQSNGDGANDPIGYLDVSGFSGGTAGMLAVRSGVFAIDPSMASDAASCKALITDLGPLGDSGDPDFFSTGTRPGIRYALDFDHAIIDTSPGLDEESYIGVGTLDASNNGYAFEMVAVGVGGDGVTYKAVLTLYESGVLTTVLHSEDRIIPTGMFWFDQFEDGGWAIWYMGEQIAEGPAGDIIPVSTVTTRVLVAGQRNLIDAPIPGFAVPMNGWAAGKPGVPIYTFGSQPPPFPDFPDVVSLAGYIDEFYLYDGTFDGAAQAAFIAANDSMPDGFRTYVYDGSADHGLLLRGTFDGVTPSVPVAEVVQPQVGDVFFSETFFNQPDSSQWQAPRLWWIPFDLDVGAPLNVLVGGRTVTSTTGGTITVLDRDLVIYTGTGCEVDISGIDPTFPGECRIVNSPTSTGSIEIQQTVSGVATPLVPPGTECAIATDGNGNYYFTVPVPIGSFNMVVTAPGAAVTIGTGMLFFLVPASLNGKTLTSLHAGLTGAGSGVVEVTLTRVRGGTADMLSTHVTIDAGELSSYTAAVASVVDTSNDDLATGDFLRVDVVGDGTDAEGLVVVGEYG